ncbi:ogr/Delta-like zinc finger family protein [Herbaspirillum sp. VT-16-41]|uniref:ogr/Delta-like zinc finger family protein n=1 Tax=Herbaspirillum sp. VT-16-41 TaxID=1953765 RepID=UPI00098264CF|nr:ogr/Delta-like zinc finger family protein [Herbaspirillum sp. VT-16-41]ONN68635.1 hypothetical protein BTM36_00005 [Herbaspirillum sp. VT-16-41]
MKEITYRCQNVDCGHTFVATLEISRTVSLSAMPNPEVSLPISPRARYSRWPFGLSSGSAAYRRLTGMRAFDTPH